MKKIIILHGWTNNLDKWRPFVDDLKTKGFFVDLLKIPGLTESLKEVWELTDYIKWLKNIVDKEREKIILIGHSNGGRIAIAFTKQYPEKVEKLILIDSAGIYHNELPLKIKRLVFGTVAKIGKRITSSKSAKNLLYKLAQESDYKNLDENAKQTMSNLILTDIKPMLPQILTPTLIIWGANDRITPLTDGLLINNLIKNSKLEVINEAKHSPMFTHTQEVAKIIYEYL
jgi:pimeloyl-ACP methyl ester carboxylesterase